MAERNGQTYNRSSTREMKWKDKTVDRGYGADHKAARNKVKEALPKKCRGCSTVLQPDGDWVLAHNKDGDPAAGYHASCRTCNERSKLRKEFFDLHKAAPRKPTTKKIVVKKPVAKPRRSGGTQKRDSAGKFAATGRQVYNRSSTREMKSRKKTTERGYGAAHKKARRELAAQMPMKCQGSHCGGVMLENVPRGFVAAHNEDGNPEAGYHASCRTCNERSKRRGELRKAIMATVQGGN